MEQAASAEACCRECHRDEMDEAAFIVGLSRRAVNLNFHLQTSLFL